MRRSAWDMVGGIGNERRFKIEGSKGPGRALMRDK